MSERQTERRTWFVSLRLKLLVGFTLLSGIALVVAFYWFYRSTTEQVMARIRDNMVATLNGAIAGVDGDEFIALAREGIPREDGLTDDPRYWRHLAWLETVHNIEPRAYPYTYVKGDEPKEVLFIGDILVITQLEKSAAFRESYISKGGMWGGLTGPNLKMSPYVDPWGSWVSAYAPIKDSKGELVGAMGIDFRADYVHQVQWAILGQALVVFAITYITLFVLVFLLSGALTRPTLALTQTAEQVAQGDYDQDIRGLYSGRLQDEISSLAQVFDSMISNIARDITERKRAEEALRESEERYRSLFDGVPVGLYRTTPDGRFLDANPALVQILGYPDRESLLAIRAADTYVNPEDRRWWQEAMEREGVVRDFDRRNRRADGTVIWMRDTGRVVRDADGRVLYYAGSVQDITERKRAEEALRRERDLAEALAEAAAVVSSTLDPDQVLDRILEQASRVVPNDVANVMLIEDDQARLARWRGYERFGAEEFISTLVFHVPETPGLQQMRESKEPMVIPDTATYPGWVRLPETEWLRSYAAAPIAVRGQVIGFLNVGSAAPGFFTQAHAETLRAFADHVAAAIENAQLYEEIKQELAERKRVEKELRESETTMRALLNAPIEAAILMDASGTILALNETAAQRFGKSANELVGLCSYDLFPPAVAKSRKAQIDRVFRLGAPVRFEDARGGRYFDNNLYPILDARGKVARIAVYARDITHRKQAEERIRSYQKRLRSLASQLSLTEERERRDIATALHDRVGQTLAICKIKLGALRQSASSTEFAEPLDEIHKYIRDIIRDTRSLTFELSSPILYELGLEAALEWLTEQTQKRDGIRAKFRDDGQPKPLDDDIRVLLFQAAQELLVNVAKHAQAHNVSVSIRRDGSDVQITVEDDGVGFGAFPIGSRWSRTEGFGLFSIRERLDHLGGQLKVISNPGHGTRVTLVASLKRATSDQ